MEKRDDEKKGVGQKRRSRLTDRNAEIFLRVRFPDTVTMMVSYCGANSARYLSGVRVFANSMSMNLSHAAALALVGWYLMTPQFNLEGKFDTSLPLSKWMMTGPVASQQECEHRRIRSFKLLDDPAIRKQLKPDIPKLRAEAARRWPNQKFPAETEKDYFDNIRKSFELSQCVSDDDPRLKGN